MAPFPETEDMTIKRLYVALKRGDMQLLQMGSHKLHEKFHKGYKFELLEDLAQILSHVNNQEIPNDIKDLLVRTISSILSNKELQRAAEEEKTIEDVVPKEIITKADVISQPVFFPPKEEKEEIKFETGFTKEEATTPAEVLIEKAAPKLESVMPEPIKLEPVPVNTILEQREEIQAQKSLKTNNIAIFYNDKASGLDYFANKQYRTEIDLISLDKKGEPLEFITEIKKNSDTIIDDISEILKTINGAKEDVYFITTSKSENIIKNFIGNDIEFQIPLVTNEDKKIRLIPLFGLSNLFVCPKCGHREYFGGFHNRVLSMQCNNCLCSMYPDVTEAQDFETNSNPYYWISAFSAMAKSKTWILINPPLETTGALASKLIKSAFELNQVEKVYILSKETSKKEYYRQLFKEINENCAVETDFQTNDAFCTEFIKNLE